ncbi:MAG: hypothetical protein ACYTXA_28185 [Nostoc sp.]
MPNTSLLRLRQRLLYETLLYETLRVACFHEVVRQAQGIALRERSVQVPNTEQFVLS